MSLWWRCCNVYQKVSLYVICHKIECLYPVVIKGWTTAGVQASERPTPRCGVQRTWLAMVSYSTVLCMPCTHVRFSFNAGTGVVSGCECPDEGGRWTRRRGWRTWSDQPGAEAYKTTWCGIWLERRKTHGEVKTPIGSLGMKRIRDVDRAWQRIGRGRTAGLTRTTHVALVRAGTHADGRRTTPGMARPRRIITEHYNEYI